MLPPSFLLASDQGPTCAILLPPEKASQSPDNERGSWPGFSRNFSARRICDLVSVKPVCFSASLDLPCMLICHSVSQGLHGECFGPTGKVACLEVSLFTVSAIATLLVPQNAPRRWRDSRRTLNNNDATICCSPSLAANLNSGQSARWRGRVVHRPSML